MPDSNPNPQIGCILAADRTEALELVFDHRPPEERRRQIDEVLACASQSEDSPFEGLLGARRNGRLVGAAFSQLHPDNNAIIWLPRLIEGEAESTARSLLAAVYQWLSQQRAAVAQVLLPTRSQSDESLLQVGGFRRLSSLLYLVAPECVFPAAIPTSNLGIESYSATNHGRFVRMIEATYEGSCDCAGLEHVHSGEDALTRYCSTGESDPCGWLLVRDENRDVGCLLLADHPRHNNMELLYLGLIPAARGHGWGKWIARHAQWLARLAGRARLVLAVDAANRPAIQTYMAVDFQAWQKRWLYVRYAPFVDNWHASSRQVIHAGCTRAPRNSKVAGMPS
jgi:mycothiol synthase